MRNTAFACVLLLAATSPNGCTQIETAVERENRLDKFAVERLPNGSKKVMDLGNDWYTFEAEINGKTRMFLYHSYHHGSDSSMDAITELSP
jgi:hypothetical protein